MSDTAPAQDAVVPPNTKTRVSVLLTKDVYKLGYVGDVVQVRRGYARNYLIPGGMAVMPTTANLRAIEEEKKAAYARRMARIEEKSKLANQIEGITVIIEARVNEQGRLFGSVGRRDVLQGVARELGYAEMTQMGLPIEVVQLHDPIRTPVENYPVSLDIEEGITATVQVTVKPDAESLAAIAEADAQQSATEERAEREARA